MQEVVQMLRTGHRHFFLLGTQANRPEVRFLTPVSLFFPLSLLIGDHTKGSRERGKKGAAEQGCLEWEQVQRQGTGRVWSRGMQREKIGRKLYTASFTLRFCAAPLSSGTGSFESSCGMFVYFQTQSARRPCSKPLSAKNSTSFTTPFKNLSN